MIKLINKVPKHFQNSEGKSVSVYLTADTIKQLETLETKLNMKSKSALVTYAIQTIFNQTNFKQN